MEALVVFVAGFTAVLTAMALLKRLCPGLHRGVLFSVLVSLLFGVATLSLWHECSVWTLAAAGLAMVLGWYMADKPSNDALAAFVGGYRLPLFLLSMFGIGLLVLVAIPITTFLTSPGELGIHLDRLLKVNARDVMVIVYSSAFVYLLANAPGLRSTMAVVATGAFFLGWIYAFILPFGYPMLTGLAFEQLSRPMSAVLLRSAIDLTVTLVVSGALRYCWLRFGSRAMLGAVLISNVSIMVAVGFSAVQDQVGQAGDANEASGISKPLTFSRSQPNTLFIFLDRFMGSHVESALESDAALAERLSGFTWYPRSVSAGENSIAGVHPMLGGYDYLPVEMNARDQPLKDLSVEAFSILPRNFAQKGYRANVVNPRGLGFTMMGDCSYLNWAGIACSHVPASVSRQKAQTMGFPIHALAEANYANLLVLLGAMRVAPYAMKEAIYAKGPWQPFLDHSAGTTFREWAELDTLNELTSIDDGPPAFNMITNILPHEPYYVGLDCLPKTTRLELPKEELQKLGHQSQFSLQHANTARCALRMVAKYLDHLKEAGVYDQTTIVIASDHGIVGSVQDNSSRAVTGGATDNTFVSVRPLVMVKEADATGPLKVSENFMPNAEVPIALCKSIGGCVNPYLNNKPIEADGRDDPFPVSLVPWQFSLQKPNAFVIRKQLMLTGKDPFNPNGWSSSAP
jgi:hypothetical protein